MIACELGGKPNECKIHDSWWPSGDPQCVWATKQTTGRGPLWEQGSVPERTLGEELRDLAWREWQTAISNARPPQTLLEVVSLHQRLSQMWAHYVELKLAVDRKAAIDVRVENGGSLLADVEARGPSDEPAEGAPR